MKARHPKTTKPRRRKQPAAARRRNSSAAGRQEQLDERSRELAEARKHLAEALEQQTATSEVLRIVSNSPGELEPVFQVMLENATRICGAKFGILFSFKDGLFHPAALHDVPPDFADVLHRQGSFAPVPGRLFGRLSETKKVIHVVDLTTEPIQSPSVRHGGARSAIAVPMLKESELVGAFFIYRTEVRPFTDKQIDLVRNFATQAVIAIENTRLLNELREALEQQTATSQVLQVISSSPGALEPVFQAMLANAVRICEANIGTLYLYDGEVFQAVALSNAPPAYLEHRRRGPLRPSPAAPLGRARSTMQVVHIADCRADQAYIDGEPLFVASTDLSGVRTLLIVPMLREGEFVGAISIYRQEVRPFNDKQIELVRNFAAQAVIAIENTRLLNELREALEQQTATSEVLRVISSSPGELQPVFQAMLANAVRICGAKFGALSLREGDAFRVVVTHGASPAFAEERRREPLILPTPGHNLERLVRTKDVVHIPDLSTDKDAAPVPFKLADARALLNVPLLKDNELIGSILIYRQETGPFGNKQIELVKNFAAQAVIAIENARLLNELRQRTDDLSEALEQQMATSEVLQVISRSPGELEPVFETMLANAVRLCEAKFGTLNLFDGEAYRNVALHNVPPAYAEKRRGVVIRPDPRTSLGRVARTKEVVHVDDVRATLPYLEGNPDVHALSDLAGARSLITVPMLKDTELIGVIGIYRQEVRPFADKQIELVQNFANQAVVAIENTRLLNELRQRTDDLSEALEQQTATAEVLSAISSSPGELEPVFNSMLENAVRICEASFGNLLLYDGSVFRHVALHNAPQAWAAEQQRDPVPPRNAARVLYRIVDTKQVTHIADMAAENPDEPIATIAGARTVLIVPMLKENALIGVIAIYRQEVRPFADKQIELVQNFAAQAVIAIENTRLLNELRESLEQQTATSVVLSTISRSPGELAAVFQAMLENATRICEAKFGILWLSHGEGFRPVALNGVSPAFAKILQRGSVVYFSPETGIARAALTKQVVQIADLSASKGYIEGDPMLVALVDIAGGRTLIAVPMLKENELVGAIAIYRLEVRPFSDKQIELVQNFANQAVIAIENTRLLNELRTRTDDLAQSVGELRALGEVSRAVNSTVDLETVLTTIVAKATQLSNTEAGTIYVFDETNREFQLRATYGMDDTIITAIRDRHIRVGETAVGIAAAQRAPIQIPDVQTDPSSLVLDVVVRAGFRALLVVPLVGADGIVGALVVRRRRPGEFPKSTVDLLQTFAAQSVLAIQNARLFSEIEDKSRQLAEASQHKSQFLANMSHELRTPLNSIIGLTQMLTEHAVRFGTEKAHEPLERVLNAGRHLLALINDILDLSKIEAGRMELHLESFPLAPLIEDVARTIEPMATKNGNRIVIDCRLELGTIHADQTRVRQALLNLASNANKFTEKGTVTIAVQPQRNEGREWITIAVADTGIGMTQEQMSRLFQEFSQASSATASKYGGTGLGLAISRRFCQMMGGDITVESDTGRGSTFTIRLPRIVEVPKEVALANTDGTGQPAHSTVG